MGFQCRRRRITWRRQRPRRAIPPRLLFMVMCFGRWTLFLFSVVLAVVASLPSCCCCAFTTSAVLPLLRASSCSFHQYQIRPPCLHIVVASTTKTTTSSGMKDDNNSSRQQQLPEPPNKQSLSRPERKALERQAKANNNKNNINSSNSKQQHQHPSGSKRRKNHNANHRHHNYDQRQEEVASRDVANPTRGRYDLHSTAVSTLTPHASSPEDVMRAIKRAQNLHDVPDLRAISRFLLEQTTDAFAYGYKGSLLARLAVAALHLQQHDIARRAIQVRRSSFATSMLPFESAALVRNLLRVHNVTDAWHVLEQELPLPLPRPPVLVDKNDSSSHNNSIESSPLAIANDDYDDALMRDRLKHRALAMASIISRHFFENEPWLAVQACNQLAREMGPLLHQAQMTATELEMPWPRLLKAASTCQSTMRSSAATSSSSAEQSRPS